MNGAAPLHSRALSPAQVTKDAVGLAAYAVELKKVLRRHPLVSFFFSFFVFFFSIKPLGE